MPGRLLVDKMIAHKVRRASKGSTMYLVPELSDFIFYLKDNDELVFEGMANLDTFPTKNSIVIRKDDINHITDIGVTMKCVNHIRWINFKTKKITISYKE